VTCGLSKQGLQTFNELAREIFISREEDGEDFDKAFKEHIEQEMASTKKTGKIGETVLRHTMISMKKK
jgi:hypothetical protein